MSRIAFCGASGAGKTTLARALSEIYGWPFVDIGVRGWLARHGVRKVGDLGMRERARMQTEVLNDKIMYERMTPDFVSDRSSLDYVAYALCYDLDLDFYNYVYLGVCHAIDCYDSVFLLPCGSIRFVPDGVRFGGQEIEQKIISVAPEGILIRIESVSLEDRLREVREYL